MKTILLTVLGFLFLVFGAIGILIPVWSTTPFVLAAVACLSSAPRIRARIVAIPFFREHIENYEHRRGLTRKTFIISMAWLWGMLILSGALIRSMWSLLLLSVIGITVTIHLLWMAKARKEDGMI
ncbi:MAG: DUF454 domain-containing protein [Clostridiaceae bacterium]|nr:DUF454 domain-containing protein [Clostridiaceae bacterium]